jgi:hypothetical protein
MAFFAELATPLIDRGLSVIPLQPGKKDPIVGPIKKTRDPLQVAEWAERHPTANVGVVADENFMILDVDDNAEIVKRFGKIDTYTVQSSPGKAHYYFRKNGFQPRNLTLGSLGSLRAVNHYVVGPNSIHPTTGKPYEIINDCEIATMDYGFFRELEELSAAVPTKTKQLLEAGEKLGEGEGRHQHLMSFCGKMFREDMDPQELFELVWAENLRVCNPPRDERHVLDMVNWTFANATPHDPGPQVLFGSEAEKDGNVDPDSWRSLFHTYEETVNAPELKFAIKGFLQEEGITMLGGLAGHGKTLLMLNIVKCLLEGTPLFGYEEFRVTRPSKRVVYLVPESGLAPFVHRLKLFGLLEHVKSDRLLYRTLSANGTLSLSDPRVKRVVEGADVFLDTAIRFMDGDENSATDQKQFAQTLFDLQRCGARTIVGAHHSPKAFGKAEGISLENALRGSGDVGAMLCTAWAVKQTDEATNEIHVRNVKARDFIPCGSFRLTGRPFIDQQSSFAMTTQPGEAEAPTVERLNKKQIQQEEARLMLASGHTLTAIAKHLKVSDKTVQRWKAAGILTDNECPDGTKAPYTQPAREEL